MRETVFSNSDLQFTGLLYGKKEDLFVNKSTLNVSYVVQIHTTACFHLFLKEYILKVLIDHVLCDYDVNSIRKNMTT